MEKTMMFETEATDLAIEPYINKNVDTNDLMEETYESEARNDFDVNIEFDEDEDNVERILGKVFDTPDEAYTFYNDYSFLHGFGIRKDDTVKSTRTNEPYRKYYVCCKEGFKRVDNNDSSGNEKKNVVEMLKLDVKQSFELQDRRMENGWWTYLMTHTIMN
ncbi:unnamed protein product [Lactuca saligna]|uniref:FAR1 domain-containing protein n=1 Tax=Lactuca saligna TaxID=75948 RepID=A0AA35Z6W7_LACSI|nr:unnamed protein product [Lactuca saligna]